MENGYSFTIITGGHRDDLMGNLIHSIHRMKIPEYEIIVCGNYKERPDIIYNHRPDWAAEAEVCKMRNFNCSTSHFENILILDDDVEFSEGWYQNIKDFKTFDITGCRGLDPEGNRWFDYNRASRIDPVKSPVMIPYAEYSDEVYISGYFMLMKKYVWEKVRFDENRKNYQHDDVDFCHRAIDNGYRISICSNAVVVHYVDPRGREKSVRSRKEYLLLHTPENERDYLEGIELLRTGDAKGAVSCLEQCRNKKSFEQNYHLALAYQRTGKQKQAEKQYFISIDIFSEDSKGIGKERIASAYLHVGEIYLLQGKREKADHFFTKTLALIPDHKKAKECLISNRQLRL